MEMDIAFHVEDFLRRSCEEFSRKGKVLHFTYRFGGTYVVDGYIEMEEPGKLDVTFAFILVEDGNRRFFTRMPAYQRTLVLSKHETPGYWILSWYSGVQYTGPEAEVILGCLETVFAEASAQMTDIVNRYRAFKLVDDIEVHAGRRLSKPEIVELVSNWAGVA